MMEKLKFQANVPVTATLKFPAGHPANKIVQSRINDGQQQVFYILADERCMYLDLGVAQKLNLLDVAAGETVNICKRGGGLWDVWLTPETERMRSLRDAGSIEQRLRASVTEACETRYATPKTPTPITAGASVSALAPAQATAVTSSHSNTGNLSTGNALVDEANAIIDAYALVLDRALTTYQGRIKPDEVRSILLSAYIQRGKAGKTYAA